MAGVKGRSGGYRPGAGRKSNVERALTKQVQEAMPTAPPPVSPPPSETASPLALGALDKLGPLEFLLAVMRGQTIATQDQIRAAIAAAQYTNRKPHDGGTKDARQKRAEDQAANPVNKFGVANQPKRIANH